MEHLLGMKAGAGASGAAELELVLSYVPPCLASACLPSNASLSLHVSVSLHFSRSVSLRLCPHFSFFQCLEHTAIQL